jgi:APA family basic amino acid/polyamine antiporter
VRLDELGDRARDRLSAVEGRATLRAGALIAIGLVALGASTYVVLGVVAGAALGLTPLVFLGACVFFLITVMTYLEGNSLHPERGGASTFARYALDELWSFIAGWAMLLDYLIVMAIGAFAVPHYLAAFWPPLALPGVEIAVAAAVVGFVAWSNVRGLTAARYGRVLVIGIVNLVVSIALIAVGLVTMLDPAAIGASIDLGRAPTIEGVVFAIVIAAAAVTAIEGGSGLAGEIKLDGPALRRVSLLSGAGALVLLVGMSVVAIAAVPVVGGATELGSRFIDAPVLGVATSLEPALMADIARYVVGLVGAVLLVAAVNGNMLGLSRLSYSLATHRQIPSALGKLHPSRSTPFVAIGAAAAIAFGLAATSDIEFLAGSFAYGAMVAFTIAHVSIIVLRFRERERSRPFRVPLSIRVRGARVPLPAVLGAVMAAVGWITVLAVHEGGRVVGTAWMLVGITLYVVYRRSQDKPLRKRFTIPADVLREASPLEYGSILVPVFGRRLDDDIMGTAGRLAADEEEAGADGGAVIEAIYVLEIPMSLPIDARVPQDRVDAARKALNRAREVGEEYEGVHVATAMPRGRSVGQTIVEEARRRGVEAIVLAAEEPTRTRGGTLLGGLRAPPDRVAGAVTRYVMEKSPCRVVLTAPPAAEGAEREAAAAE